MLLFLLFSIGVLSRNVKPLARYDVECENVNCHRLKLNYYNHISERDSIPNSTLISTMPITTATTDDGMIKFFIECISPTSSTATFPEDFCPNIVAAFKIAGNYISNLVNLIVPVSVHAKLTSFCSNPSLLVGLNNSLCGTLLGSGKPASFLNLTGIQISNVLYPQALAKQLVNVDSITFNQYDIEMDFNSDMNFYFSPDVMKLSAARASPRAINSNQYDFLFVALHELLHGFGISSLWNLNLPASPRYAQYVPNFNAKLALFPAYIQSPGSSNIFSSIFDHFIVSVDSRGNEYRWSDGLVVICNRFLPASATSSDNTNALLVTQKLYNDSVTPNAVRFAYPNAIFGIRNGAELSIYETLLDTKYPVFQSGSSVVHVDRSYKSTSDFLMAPSLNPGISLDSMMMNDPLSPIGKRAAGILISIGYTPRNNVGSLLNKELTSDSKSHSQSIGMVSLLAIVFSISLII